MMSVCDYRPAVEAGYELLRQHGVSDERIIMAVHAEDFCVADCDCCVLGKLFGSFGAGMDSIGLDSRTHVDAAANGFDGPGTLDQAWRDFADVLAGSAAAG